MNKGYAQKQKLNWSGLDLSSKVQYALMPSADTIIHPILLSQSIASTNLTYRGLSFGLTYSYTSPQSLIGVRNGFTFRFNPSVKAVDPHALQASLEKSFHSKIDSLNQLSTNYQKRLQYLESFKGDSLMVPKWNLMDTSLLSSVSIPVDSLTLSDSLSRPIQSKRDSLQNKFIAVESEISRCKQALTQLTSLTESYQAQLDGLRSKKESIFENPFSKSLPFQLRKLEVGNFTANNSPITLFGTSLFGVSSAFNKGSYYLEGGIGKVQTPSFPELSQMTISKQMFSAIHSWSSSFSSASRSLAWVTVGKGRPEQTHVYAQAMTGRGKRNLLDTQSGNAINYVLELQGQWVKGTSKVEINLAKSFLSRPMDLFSDSFSKKGKYDVGYAVNVNLSHSFEKLKSDFGAKLRYFNPAFNSFGVAMSRRDYLQSQLSWKQGVGKNVRLVVQGKYDLAGLKVKTYDFRSLNASLRMKMLKRANLSMTGTMNKGIIVLDTSVVAVNQSLVSGMYSMPIKLGKLIPIFTAQRIIAFNYQENVKNKVQNSSLNVLLTKNAFSCRIGYSDILQQNDSLNQRMTYCEASLGLTKSKWNASLNFKQNMAVSNVNGFGLSAGLVLSSLVIQLTAEKFVYDPIATPWLSKELATEYPFRGSLQLTYTIKNSKS